MLIKSITARIRSIDVETLGKYLLLVILLNTLDLVGTLIGIHYGWIVEANPIMQWFLINGIGPFIAVKMGFFMIYLFIIDLLKEHPASRYLVVWTLGVYLLVAIHISSIYLISLI